MATSRPAPEKDEDFELLSDGPQPAVDGAEAATSSKEPNEPCDIGDGDSGSASDSEKAEFAEGGEGDHDSDSLAETDDVSELSNLSGLNDQSVDEAMWQPLHGPRSWIRQQIAKGVDPRDVLRSIINFEEEIPAEYDECNLWEVILNLIIDPLPRHKLNHVNTLDDVVQLLRNCQNILVLTGAGVSVSCGIPDFRSRDGIYARLAKDYPNLPDPESMFDIHFFKSDQRPFFKFAKEIYPGQFDPSPCHRFIKLLETKAKLLRNYTQNIDTIEKVTGIERAIECHGSFATATCMECRYKVDAEVIREDIFSQVIPHCPRCGPEKPQAVMKPDIVFFGEDLPEKFHRQMAADKDVCDLLIVMGSSLKVRPVALIPNAIPHNVPQILINREPLPKHMLNFDVELLGNCDDIVSELCKRLGEDWDHLSCPGPAAEEVNYYDLPSEFLNSPEQQQVGVVKEREELVEHSADSGLGDWEAASASHNEDRERQQVSCSGSHTPNSSNRVLWCDRLERLSSSDSGAESSITAELHGQPVTTTATSEQCADSGDVPQSLSKETVKHNSACIEVSAQGERTCKKGRQKSDGSPHQCQVEKSSQLVGAETKALSSHLKKCKRKPEMCSSSDPQSTSDGEPPCKRHRLSQSSEDGDLDVESEKDDHCSHTDTFEEMRHKWVPRKTRSIACRLKKNQIMFIPPNRYIFPGAEVFSDSSDSSDDDTTPPTSPAAKDFDQQEEGPTPPLSPTVKDEETHSSRTAAPQSVAAKEEGTLVEGLDNRANSLSAPQPSYSVKNDNQSLLGELEKATNE